MTADLESQLAEMVWPYMDHRHYQAHVLMFYNPGNGVLWQLPDVVSFRMAPGNRPYGLPFLGFVGNNNENSVLTLRDDDDDDYDDDDADDDDVDDDDASPVVIAGPGNAQAFAVYIYITHTSCFFFGLPNAGFLMSWLDMIVQSCTTHDDPSSWFSVCPLGSAKERAKAKELILSFSVSFQPLMSVKPRTLRETHVVTGWASFVDIVKEYKWELCLMCLLSSKASLGLNVFPKGPMIRYRRYQTSPKGQKETT